MLVELFKIACAALYGLLKFFLTPKNRVSLITRRLNYTSLDFRLLETRIHQRYPKYDVIILNHRQRSKVDHALSILVEMFYLATSKAIIVDSYVIPVSILKHRDSLKIIQIWHALGAVKKFGHQSLGKVDGHSSKIAKQMHMHRGYNFVCSGSKEISPIFAEAFNIDQKNVLPIGEPRVDYLVKYKDQKSNQNFDAIYDRYPEMKGKKVILYAPTFRKKASIKTDELIKKIDLTKYCLIFKPHPVDRKTKTDVTKYPQGIICDESFEVIDLLLLCDYLITDYSAIVFEASIIKKPMYFWVYDLDKYASNNGLNYDIKKFAPGFVSKSSQDIVDAIKNDNFDIKKISDFSKRYISVQDGTSTDKIIDKLKIK